MPDAVDIAQDMSEGKQNTVLPERKSQAVPDCEQNAEQRHLAQQCCSGSVTLCVGCQTALETKQKHLRG